MITIENITTGVVKEVNSIPDYCSLDNPSLVDSILKTFEWRLKKVYVVATVDEVEKAKGEPVNWCKFCERYVVNKCIWSSQKKHCNQ